MSNRPFSHPASLSATEIFAINAASSVVSTAGWASCQAPFERIKLLMQTQHENIKSGYLDRPYKGAEDCFMRTMRSEGALSLWNGNTANIIRLLAVESCSFLLNARFRALFKPDSNDHFFTALTKNFAAGAMAGAVKLVFVYPLDYARTRLTVTNTSRTGTQQFRGLIDIFSKSYRADGARGFYRGFDAAVLQSLVYGGFYFGLFYTLKPFLSSVDTFRNSFKYQFLATWLVTVLSGLAAYPLDTISRRMMMTSCNGNLFRYQSSSKLFMSIIRQGGVLWLFSGASVVIARSLGGAIFLAFMA